MSSNMDEAARFLRERLGSSMPKAGSQTTVSGDHIVINNHGAGQVIVGRDGRRRWWERLLWLVLVVAACLSVAYGINSAAAAELATAAVVCDSIAGDDGQLRTSCVAVRPRTSFWANHASLRDQVFTALTSAANACIAALYPTSSGFIHALPPLLTPPDGSQPLPPTR